MVDFKKLLAERKNAGIERNTKINISSSDNKQPEETKVKKNEMFNGFELSDEQQAAVDGIREFIRRPFDIDDFEACMSGLAGTGKGHPVGTLVLCENGEWKRIETLKPGNKIMTPFNGLTKIKQVFHRGIQQCYKFYFDDGRSIICDSEHLWMVRTSKMLKNYRAKGKNKTDYSRIMSAEELYNDMENSVYVKKIGYKYKVPICGCISFDDKCSSLPIDPYVLGVLIGDGYICRLNKYKKSEVLVISNDEDDVMYNVLSRIRKGTFFNFHNESNYSNKFYGSEIEYINENLKKMGLCVKSRDKFIPEEYLNSDVNSRMDLIKGLMDTDGTVDEKGRYRFSTLSIKLANDFVYLCRSLGYKCTLNESKRCRSNEVRIEYTVQVQTDDVIVSSMKHTKKVDSYKSKEIFRQYCDHCSIVKIEKLEEKQQTVCLSIEDKDKLFVVQDFIVSHNTSCTKLIVKFLKSCGYKFVLCAPTHKAKYVLSNVTNHDAKTLHSFLNLSPNLDVEALDMKKLEFKLNLESLKDVPLNGLILVDECSMVGQHMMELIRKAAIRYEAKVLYCGE